MTQNELNSEIILPRHTYFDLIIPNYPSTMNVGAKLYYDREFFFFAI